MQITLIVAQGDGTRMHEVWRDELLPVAEPKAAEYGWLRSVVAASDAEFVVLNVWESADGLDRAAADPDIAAVQDRALVPLATAPPEVRRLDVVEDLRLGG